MVQASRSTACVTNAVQQRAWGTLSEKPHPRHWCLDGSKRDKAAVPACHTSVQTALFKPNNGDSPTHQCMTVSVSPCSDVTTKTSAVWAHGVCGQLALVGAHAWMATSSRGTRPSGNCRVRFSMAQRVDDDPLKPVMIGYVWKPPVYAQTCMYMHANDTHKDLFKLAGFDNIWSEVA